MKNKPRESTLSAAILMSTDCPCYRAVSVRAGYEEDTLSETELQQLYGEGKGGGGGGGGGSGARIVAVQGSEEQGKEEEESLATRGVARPAGVVLNKFALTTSSQPRQFVRSRYMYHGTYMYMM